MASDYILKKMDFIMSGRHCNKQKTVVIKTTSIDNAINGVHICTVNWVADISKLGGGNNFINEFKPELKRRKCVRNIVVH